MSAFVGGAKWKWALKSQTVGRFNERLNYPVTLHLLEKAARWYLNIPERLAAKSFLPQFGHCLST